MLKKNKIKLIIASLAILLPSAAGAVLWDKLPEKMTVHWGLDGTADGWGGRLFAVIGLPLILLAVFWLCILITAKDPKNKDQNHKAFGMIIWIMPFVSFFAMGMTYLAAFGKTFAMYDLVPVFIGVLLAFIGNYMPKCKQNHTIGIKVKWTLENEENWNRTHRFAGKIWFFGGMAITLTCLLPDTVGSLLFLVLLLACVFAPFVYSYAFYKKQVKDGSYTASPAGYTDKKWVKVLSAVLISAVLIGTAVVMFTGGITVTLGSEEMTVDSTYWSGTAVKYSDIKSVEYADTFSVGMRIYGFSSARLLLGSFENSEWGNYDCYCYTNTDPCIVIETNDGVIVINSDSAEATKNIYDELILKAEDSD